MASSSGVRGFLFADLRGYTRFVEAHGDAAAAELLADYRDLVRAVIGRHEGAEIRTEGDGVYVVFESVVGAVDAGLELVEAARVATDANRDGQMRVAVGIHAGETAVTGEGPVGSAVNIAARICAKAEAGEVLVSETVRSLVRTARPYRATSLGHQHLKGVAETIVLHRLEAAPSGLLTRLRRKVRARRRTLSIAGLVGAVLLIAAGAAWTVNRPPDCLTLPAGTKDTVVRIDPARACVVRTIAVGQGPRELVATATAIWVADQDDWTVTRLDPTAWTTRVAGVPGRPVDLAPVLDEFILLLVWNDRTPLSDPNRSMLIGIDPQTLRIRGIEPLENEYSLSTDSWAIVPGYVALAEDAAGRGWVLNHHGTVTVVGERFLETVPVEQAPPGTPAGTSAGLRSIDAGAGGIWIADADQAIAYRLDAPEAPPSSFTLGGPGGSTTVDALDSAVWFGRVDGRVTRLDAFGANQSFDTGGEVSAIAATADAVWVVDGDAATVRRVDPDTGEIISIPVGGRPAAIVIGLDGGVYVALADG